MSAVNRGARTGVAALALGLSLAGPQVIATASADPGDTDTASVSSGQSDPGPARPRRSHTAQNADSDPVTARRGRPAPGTAADAGIDVSDADKGAGPRANRRGSERLGANPQAETIAPAAAATPAAAESATPPGPDSNTAAGSVGSPGPTHAPAAVAVTPRPAAAVTGLFSGPPPPVLAKSVATIGAAITGFFDSTANWISSLPGGPIADFLEGALLLARRTFFNTFPVFNTGQTTGQNDPACAACFTDAQMRDYLLGLAKQRYGSLFGSTVPVYSYAPYPEYLKIDDAVSDTNTQVAGVDEADFVETDGDYIYVAHGGNLTITRAGDLSVASQSPLTGDVLGQYLSGDTLTVITQSGSGWYGPVVKMAYPIGLWKPQTTVTVYDVTDRTAPAVIKQTVFDGAYQSSRAVDGEVYVVMQRSVNLPAPAYTDTPIAYATGGTAAQGDPAAESKIRYDPSAPIAYRTYETWDSYVARVGDQIVAQSLPHAYRVESDGSTVDLGVVAGPQDIVRPKSDSEQSVLTVVSVDAGDAAFSDGVGALVSSSGSTVYMTRDALYVGSPEDHYSDAGYSSDTRIDRFAVAGPALSWQSSGTVPGTLINQFAIDESDGQLRVTTHDTVADDNGIYVLDATTLEEVGRLTGLAPGEQLYAVRYVGDTGYLVTFVRTDPLFAVDLSDPTAPRLLGELIVPGFSNYLQPVGDGLLLGIGQERDAGSSNTHLHATLFDVSDGAAMTQIERQFLDPGYQWSWSDAQFDHHAVLYSAEDGLLIVPVSGSGYDPQTGYRSAQYLSVLRLSPSGIEVVGQIHPEEPTLRTVRIGDLLYAVGDTTVTAYRLSDLSEIARSVSAPSVV